jgi:hypothetical protein
MWVLLISRSVGRPSGSTTPRPGPLHPELLHHFAKFYGYTDVRVGLVSKPEVPRKIGSEADGEAVLSLQKHVLSGQDAGVGFQRPVSSACRCRRR